MKLIKILLISAVALITVASAAAASDFAWTRNFNRQAKADPIAFRTRLAARFDLSDIQVMALRNIFASPADAYIMLRLGEIQGGLKKLSREQALDAVQKYRCNRDKGWIELAEILGIETESREFTALKRDHDMHEDKKHDQMAYTGFERSRDSL